MDTESTSAPQEKQVTVDVPEDRVAEFYALYARFLAGRTRGRRGPGHGFPGHGRGPRHGHGHGCHGRHAEHRSEVAPEEVQVV